MVFSFLFLWKVNYVWLEMTKKVDYQVQVQCIYQNIGGEGVGYCKVKKKEKLQNRLPLDQNYCPLIYTCLIYLISWTIYYFYDIIGLIVQVKPHTNMVKYFFPTEKKTCYGSMPVRFSRKNRSYTSTILNIRTPSEQL